MCYVCIRIAVVCSFSGGSCDGARRVAGCVGLESKLAHVDLRIQRSDTALRTNALLALSPMDPRAALGLET